MNPTVGLRRTPRAAKQGVGYNYTPPNPWAKHALNVTHDQDNLTHMAISCKIIERLEQITLKNVTAHF